MQERALRANYGKLTRPPTSSGSNVLDPLADQLGRLGSLLDQEIATLKAGQLGELSGLTQRKLMMLLQLGTHPASPGRQASPSLLRELASIRDKLSRNLQTLQLNIRALQELSEVLAECHRNADSDGTYSIYKR